MPRYLIKVSQPARIAADQIAQSIRKSGSHFATHAEWCHADGAVTGTLVVEVNDRYGALAVVPPNMRSGAHVDELAPPADGVGSTSATVNGGQALYPLAA